jgi:formimidoylglutamate deiminase
VDRARTYRSTHAWRVSGWVSPGYITVGSDGTIVDVTSSPAQSIAASAEAIDGFAIPGIPNVHSHAHMRALAGSAEPAGSANATFWSWRDRMYRVALRLGPEDLEAIAAQAFVEMVAAGFTSVAEFHYLHHDPSGDRYSDPAELSERVIAAAASAGIGLTLLPALYMHGGVDAPLEPRQRRFAFGSVEEYVRLIDTLSSRHRDRGLVRIGAAPHSVRAVTEQELREMLDGLGHLGTIPLHIHLSEQRSEVEESRTRRGETPGRWLQRRVDLSSRWTLIHATHCDREELGAIARAHATVGICPVTEANLGDGIFPLSEYEDLAGTWAVGTDSNTVISAGLELAVLEYVQRLRLERRAVHGGGTASAAERCFSSATRSGAIALGQPVGSLEPGKRADLLVFDHGDAAFAGHGTNTLLDAWLVNAGAVRPRMVMVGGEWVVRDDHHVREGTIRRRFDAAIARLS